MSRNDEEPESYVFRDAVESRYQRDLIMTGEVTVAVILVPFIITVFLFLLSLSHDPRWDALDNWIQWLFGMMMIEWFTVMIIIFKMYDRLKSHAYRDRAWRRSLIEFVRSKGGDVSRLSRMNQSAERKERFGARFLVLFILAVMFFYMGYNFLFNISGLTPENLFDSNFFDDIKNAIRLLLPFLGGLALVILQFLVVFTSVLSFPFRHEQEQVKFSEEVAVQLARAGYSVPSMAPTLTIIPLFFHLVMIFLTFGLYILVLLFTSLRSMNEHLMNQWVYETEMLRFIESDGREGFDDKIYQRVKTMEPRSAGRLLRKYSVDMLINARVENRMPASLMIAELFVLVLCASYMLKMVGIELDITATGIDPQFTIDYITSLSQDMLTNYVLFMINLALLTFSIYSLLGIASRKPSSWRNVCRSCITFVIPLWLGVLFTMPDTNAHMFDFNPYITTGVLYNVLVLMLVSYSIKRFYVPVDPVIPRFRVWVRFIFFGKLKDEKRQARPAAAAMGTDANGTSGTPVFHAEPEPPEEPPAEEEPEPAEAGEYVLKIIAPKKFVKVKKDRGDHFEVECNDEIMGFMPGQMVEMTLPEGDYMVVVRQVNGNGKLEVGKKVSLHAETRLWCKEEKGGLALEKGA